MSAAVYLSGERLAKGVAAFFAVQVDTQVDEDTITRRLRAAIVATVGDRLIDETASTDAVAALNRAAHYIRNGHPHGVDATIAELDIARQLLAGATQ